MQHAAKRKQNVKKEEEEQKKSKRIRNIQIKREPSAFFSHCSHGPGLRTGPVFGIPDPGSRSYCPTLTVYAKCAVRSRKLKMAK